MTQHWADKPTSGRLPWRLSNTTASSSEWIIDADGDIIGFVTFARSRDRKRFIKLVDGEGVGTKP